MLDGLLGRSGFSSKCKSLIKPTRTRMEVMRRRAEAKQRFLKEDLAKLLANGLDVNAYGRTEEFIAGLNVLSCYTFIDQSCEYIYKQMSVMQKLGQCPEECRETVASLMFAAARFSDLPELRDLRDVFEERYGNGLECYVNQTFVEKLASKPPVMEKRIKLLQDIAAEFSIQWDAKGFKQRMDKPSTLSQDQPKKLGPSSVTDDKYKPPNGNTFFRKNDQRSKERMEHTLEGPTVHNNGNGNGNGNVRRKEHACEGTMLQNGENVNVRRKEVLDIPFVRKEEKHNYKHEGITSKAENGVYFSKAKPESASEKNGFEKNDINTPFMMKISGGSYHDRKPEVFNDDRVNRVRKERHGYKQEPVTNRAETMETRNNNDGLFKRRQEFAATKHGSSDGADHTPLMNTPRSSRDRRPEFLGGDRMKEERPDLLYHGKSEGISNGTRHPVVHGNGEDAVKPTGKRHEGELIRLKSLPPPYVKSNIPPPYTSKPKVQGSMKLPDHEIGEDRHYQKNDIPLPKPRSIRRKHSKSSSSHDDIGSSEDADARIVKRISSSRRKERKGLQILFDDEHYHHKDEEEKMMDKLLLHYSKKPSAYHLGRLKKKKSRSNTRSADEAEMIVPPTRSISLPHEPSGESEPKKVYARANSFQPDNQARHVHPKLPDYDDLAAQFAALRGR